MIRRPAKSTLFPATTLCRSEEIILAADSAGLSWLSRVAREGMDGISPRYIINRLSSALVRDGVTCINPIDALRAIKDGFEQHTGISSEQRERYLNHISQARKEYDELAKIEVQRAFVYSFEEMARTMCNNYLDNVEAFCNKERIKDPITEEEMEPDEQLMRSIEEQIGEIGRASCRERV